MSKVILQHDERDCGPACLVTIADAYHHRLTLSQARQYCKTDHSGTNMYGLVEAAKEIGFVAEAMEGTPADLVEALNNRDVVFPFIAHTVNDQQMQHFIVVFGVKNDKFVIGDPGEGKIHIDQEVFWEMWTGYIINLYPGENFHRDTKDIVNIKLPSYLIKDNILLLLMILVMSLIIALISISGAYIFEIAIDNSVGIEEQQNEELLFNEEATSGYEDSITDTHVHTDSQNNGEKEEIIVSVLDKVVGTVSKYRLGILCTALIGLYVFQAIIQVIRGWLILYVSKRIDMNLTLGYFCHIQDIKIADARTFSTGDYLSRLSDASAIREAVSSILVTIILDTVLVICCGFLLFHINPSMFGISFVVMMLYAFLVLLYKKPIEKFNRLTMSRNASTQAYLKESIDGLETIRCINAIAKVKEKSASKFEMYIDAAIKNSMLAITQNAIANALELIGAILILWLGFSLIGKGDITLGSVVTYYALLSFFTEPIKNLIEIHPQLQKAIVAAERLHDVIDLPCEETTKGINMPENIEEWHLDNISFRYGFNPLLINNISFCLQRGEFVAIVGESGSGKTTIAKLFLRFYAPETGSITADGTNINEYALDELRNNVAYVSQETFLFSDSIRNNLTCGRDVSEEQLKKACKITALDKWVDTLPLQLDTLIDENAVNLSGGQRQQIAICRALLLNPQLLILDEATSNIDSITEREILGELCKKYDKMTIIMITHQLQLTKSCDCIFVMNKGSIVERGTHEQLLKNNSNYADLWKKSTI